MKRASIFFYILYDLLLAVCVPFLFPKQGIDRLLKRGKKRSLFKRLFPPRIAKRKAGKCIWLHAVSVGEVRAAAPLIAQFLSAHKNLQIFVSTTTLTGREIAKQEIPQAQEHFILPFDFSWNAHLLLKRIAPNLLLFVEGDLWPNLLRIAKSKGVKTALVNGKLSKRSSSLYSRFSLFSRSLFTDLDLICVQSEKHYNRISPLVENRSVHITGNLKFDRKMPLLDEKTLPHLRQRLGISEKQTIVTIGSTHPKEEELILDELKEELSDSLRVLLVPRHPERSSLLAKQLREKGFTCSLFSQQTEKNEQITIVDEMGTLCSCYQMSDLAIVGGSFVKGIGGHNLFEPLAYGVPVVFGPYIQAQEEMGSIIIQERIGMQISSSKLRHSIKEFLGEKTFLEELRKQVRVTSNALRGASQATYELLTTFLDR